MKPSPRHILALWRQNPAWQPSFTEILRALGGHKNESRQLQKTLVDLVSGGKLRHRNRRYGLVADEGDGGRASSTPAPESQSGGFSAHPDGFGFVAVEGGSQSVFIPPHAIAGALDGDRVRIVPNRPRPDGRSSGRVVEILARARQQVRGTVQFEDGDCWVKPLNQKLPYIFIAPAEEAPYRRDEVVDAVITEFPADARSAPEGRITGRVRQPDAPESIVAAILAEQNIPTAFSRQTQREMTALRKNRPAAATEGRRDLTDLPFVTIDGEDARDFDDAVCLLPGGKGSTRLLVAIADVAEYVRPGSAVDGEAYARGTSVYFPDRVVPMLPEVLSNDLCSLKPGEPRLTLTCDMEFDGAGTRKAYRIYESTIRSQARLTYGQVLRFIETGNAGALASAKKLAPMIEQMGAFSRVLIEKRRARGALDFEFPEARVRLNSKGDVEALLKALPDAATRLIEQLMVEANETVAWHCAENSIPTLYRVHDPPPPDLAGSLRLQLWNLGIAAKEADLAKPAGINRVLRQAAAKPFREQIELAVLKSMSQAQYRLGNDGHFGLAATHYTHFTSPIRRYPDLLVHRALKATAHGRGSRRSSLAPLAEAGVHLSTRERVAGDAEGKVIRLYKVLFMERFLGQDLAATVTGVSRRGLFLSLRDQFAEGLLPLELLTGDRYRFDAQGGALIGGRQGRRIAVGERLTAQLVRADRLVQELEFGLTRWGWEEE